MALHIQKFAGVPNTVPTGIGHHFLDTANRDAYISIGTSTVADWILNAQTSTSFSTFLALLDTPADYTGRASNFLKVNPAETALEFVPSTDISASTGLLLGASISINAGNPATFDMTQGTAIFVDAFTDPLAPTSSTITFGPLTGVAVTNLGSFASTELLVLANGTVEQISGVALDGEVLRTKVSVGALIHPSNIQIDAILDVYVGAAVSIGNTVMDLFLALGPFNISGNLFFPNGTNLMLDKNAGQILFLGANYKASRANPNVSTLGLRSPVTFIYTWRDGIGGWNSSFGNTVVNPNNYDDGTGGTGTPDGVVGNNNWSIQTIVMSTTNDVLLYYAQETYPTQLSAEEAIRTQTFVTNPEFQGAIFRCWLVLADGTTDLTVPQNSFHIARKFDTLD